MKKIILKIVFIIITVFIVVGSLFLIDYLIHKDDCCSPCKDEEVCMTVCSRCSLSDSLKRIFN